MTAPTNETIVILSEDFDGADKKDIVKEFIEVCSESNSLMIEEDYMSINTEEENGNV